MPQPRERKARPLKLDNRKRRTSAIEAVVNIGTGAVINGGLSWLVFEAWGVNGWSVPIVAVLVFTPSSVARAYLLRRLFVRLGGRK